MKATPSKWIYWEDINGMMRGKYESWSNWDAKNPTYNRPLFTLIYLLLCKRLGYSEHYIIKALYLREEFETFEEEGPHQSHDNAKGVIGLCKENDLFSPVPIFNKERPHPRDVVLFGMAHRYFKYFWWLFVWIPCLAFIVSAYQTWKVRGDQVFKRTDGKLIAWAMCEVFDLKLTKKICTWLIKRNSEFASWGIVADIYYGHEHPIALMMREYEGS